MKKKTGNRMKVVRNDKEVEGRSIGSCKTGLDKLYDLSDRITRDIEICKKCDEFNLNHVYYGCKRKFLEPPPPPPPGTIVFLGRPVLFDGNPTDEEMKLPENQPFFCEDYDEYTCFADAEFDGQFGVDVGYGCHGSYKKDFFEHSYVSKKCIYYVEQYISFINRKKK